MINKKKIWIFTFELAGIAKVGGLGEVPANQARYLKDKFDVTVFIPSHGQVQRQMNTAIIEKLDVMCKGKINPNSFSSIDEIQEYRIEYYLLNKEGIKIVLIKGVDDFSSSFLENENIYGKDVLMGKVCFFSLAMKYYIRHLIQNNKNGLPDIIHLHDYHSVIPFIALKQELNENDLDVHSIITIHLLTWPRYGLDFYHACGVDDRKIRIKLKDGFKNFSIKEIHDLIGKNVKKGLPTVEQMGALVCDLVTTVSKSYLNSDIIPNCGNELIKFKSDFIWDGCDWDYNNIRERILSDNEKEIRTFLRLSKENTITRKDLRRFLLEYKLGHLTKSPLINSEKVLQVINEISNGNPFIKNGTIKPFSSSGPLILTTGRISPQKGFEIIFESMPTIIKHVQNVKFLFLILPTDYSLNEIKIYASQVKKYPNNVRIIFGVASDIFHLAHLSADIFCALSRWEPFGIMALEAMALKLPIIATRVGGLQETVIDIRENPKEGTGILIEKDNLKQFISALISMIKLSELGELAKSSNNQGLNRHVFKKMVKKIPDKKIKLLATKNPKLYDDIMENCLKRVKENFTWEKVTKKLIRLYDQLLI
ncbi:MAG: glycogen/starch synthase [Promethearchaeota archaeon]